MAGAEITDGDWKIKKSDAEPNSPKILTHLICLTVHQL